MPVRTGSAEWKGKLPDGSGTLSTETGVLKDVPYNFPSRFETGDQTNPEELLGAAHSACFSMALAGNLARAGFKVNSVKTEDMVHIEKMDNGFKITKIEIRTEADVEGADDAAFQEQAEKTKKTCPVSQALTGVEMVLTAKLK